MAESRQDQSLSTNTKLLGITSMANDISSEMIVPILPIFLTTILGAPAIVVGLMDGLADFVLAVMRFLSGLYSDKIGKRRRLIAIGYGISAFTKPLFSIVQAWPLAVMLRVSDRFGKGLRNTPRDALIAYSEPDYKLGKAFGFRKMMDALGATIGPMIATILLVFLGTSESSYREIFLLAAVPAILGTFLIIFVRDKQHKNGKATKRIIDEITHVPQFKELMYVGILFSIGQFSVMFFVLKGSEFMTPVLVTLAYLAYNVTYTVFAMPAGHAVDRFGPKKMLIAAYAVFAVSLLLAAYSSDWMPMFLSFIVLGLFMAIQETAPRVMIVERVNKSEIATGIGMYQAGVGMALFPANLIAGALWGVGLFGTSAAFVFSIIISLAAVGYVFMKIK